jgi:uncharacterized protein (DUF2141 family)
MRSVAFVLTLLFAGSARAQEAPPPAPTHRLVVTVVTRNDHGKVFCAIWHGRRGYPTDHHLAVGETLDRTIVHRRAVCIFDRLVPNQEYAVAVFHDENANNDLDRGIFGIPTEGTGASNDASGFMAPPPYDGARFRFPDVPEHRIRIRVGYR